MGGGVSGAQREEESFYIGEGSIVGCGGPKGRRNLSILGREA